MQAGSTARRRMGGETGERGGAGHRDQGNTKKSRGHTQGAREQQGARAQNQKEKEKKTTAGRADTQEGHKEEAARGRWGGTEGQRGRNGTQCLSQRSTMPLTRIEPYRPPRPTIRELMEGRPAGEDDGGVPPKGCLGRPPRSAYRSEDRAEALRHVRAREIQPWRGDDQRRAHGAGEQH